MPCYEENGLLWVQGVHGKVGESPEVVRCRECRWYLPEHKWCHHFDDTEFAPEPDGYCKWGERRDA